MEDESTNGLEEDAGEGPSKGCERERSVLKALMASIPDRIYFKDLQGRFVYGSNSLARFYGLEGPAELYGKTDFDCFSEEHASQAFADEQEIIRTGRHLLSLIDNILDLSKIEAGRMIPCLEACCIAPMLDEMSASVESLAAKNRNRFTCSIDPAVPVIRTDARMLRQILFNLLGNAAKLTQDGALLLEVRPDAEDRHFVRFTITDSGIGMDDRQLGSIFQEYAQADESTRKQFGGTGLGLTICMRYVGLLGGEIRVSSRPGEGSAFVVRIPSTPSPSETSDRPVF